MNKLLAILIILLLSGCCSEKVFVQTGCDSKMIKGYWTDKPDSTVYISYEDF